MHSKPAEKQQKRGFSKDYFDRAGTKKLFDQCDNLVYGPMRRAEEQLRKEEAKIKAQVRSMNLRWRLDAIDAVFNRIFKEIDTIVKVVMNSYGCHRHRGEWRRRRCGRKKRLEQNTLIKNDLLRARHVAKHGPRRPVFLWDYYLHPESRTAQGSATCQVASSPTATPSDVRKGSTFPAPASSNSCGSAAAPGTLPHPSQLPYKPSHDPLFARAMDGTTFLSPRPFPPEPADTTEPSEPTKPQPLLHAKRLHRPSERQVHKLYEVALAGPPPEESATRYTDARVFLAEIGPLGWQRYGAYFYDFFKRRILDRSPRSPIPERGP